MRSHLKKILAKATFGGMAILLGTGLLSASAFGAVQSYNLSQGNEFVVADVRLQGLQRVSAGTVFNIIPVGVGDPVDNVAVRSITRALFASGYFNDIKIARDDAVLIVTLTERPPIESIELDGNKAIESEALLEGLADQGLQEGEIFKQATLERMGLELERQYVAQGRYGASIDTEIEDLPRNRFNIKINDEEGKSS